MRDTPLPPRRSLESLKKEAKRWLDALRADDPEARSRFTRVLGAPPVQPSLREVQHALAREHGFDGWTTMVNAIEEAEDRRAARRPTLSDYDMMVTALLEAYRTGTPEAMEAHHRHTWHRRAWQSMRTYVQLDLGKRPQHPGDDVDITVDDARYLVARDHGFSSWDELREDLTRTDKQTRKPTTVVPWAMTNDDVAEFARNPNVTRIELGGAKAISDEGIRHLARLEHLEHLDLSGTAITDRGLDVLQSFPLLKTLSLSGTRVTDAGIRVLANCEALESVNLMWTQTGDAAIRALTGKPKLAKLWTGNLVTDAGLPFLHEIPVFKIWHGGEPDMALLSYDSSPNQLTLRGPFTDRGMESLRGLDGLFGLNIDARELGFTARGLEPLVSLANLGWLAVDAKDDWMPYIAAMPKLRFLGAQDTVAGDDGFEALGKSPTIEYIWGRRCHNLRDRGFVALSKMPALRGLSVSCLNVSDAALSSLPSFPALRELMPMDVPDASYTHIGKCDELESLILMYCRDTTDAATERITGLRKLKYYFNSYTTITDRTPELLSTMDSLERITLDSCHNLTNAGVIRLARLPKLRELSVSGRGLAGNVTEAFPPSVKVSFFG